MNKTVLTILSVTLLLCTGCLDRITGSGVNSYRSFTNTGFEQVSIASACNATVTEGEEYSVEIDIDDNLTSYVQVYQQDKKLFIKLKNGYNYRDVNFRATIRVPVLTEISASDASSAHLLCKNPMRDLTIRAKDASGISGTIEAATLNCVAYDASDLTLKGAAKELLLKCSDASEARMKSISTENASVDITDASEASLSVSGKISGELSDASRLYYYGSPTVTVKTKDASELIKRELSN